MGSKAWKLLMSLDPRRVVRRSGAEERRSHRPSAISCLKGLGPMSPRAHPIDLGLSLPPRGRGVFPRKEVIQPHLPVRLPCYDFVPIAGSTLDGCPLALIHISEPTR